MAEFRIWMPTDLQADVRVFNLCQLSGESLDTVIGRLYRLWNWVDVQSANERMNRVTPETLASVIRGTTPEFWSLAGKAKLIHIRSGAMEFPGRGHNQKLTGPKSRKGYVYFFLAPSIRCVKIGFTSGKTARRIKEVQTGCSEPLELLATMPGGMALESSLHKQFAAYRKSGEWFEFSDEIKAFIEGIR